MAGLVKGFVRTNTDSGSGNGTVSFWAGSKNTGRDARSLDVTFSAANVSNVYVTVNQSGKTEYVLYDNTDPSVPGTGGTLTLYGKSNSKSLVFSIGALNEIGLSIPTNYVAAGITTNATSGAVIGAGTAQEDPGKSEEFTWSITFNIGANTGISAKKTQIIVTDFRGDTHTCEITLDAGAATLSVSPTTVNLAWDADTQQSGASVTVTSNTSWTIA